MAKLCEKRSDGLLHTHETFTANGDLELVVMFTEQAEIISIKAHVPSFDAVLSIDVESFATSEPRTFARLQKEIEARAGYEKAFRKIDQYKFHPLIGVTSK